MLYKSKQLKLQARDRGLILVILDHPHHPEDPVLFFRQFILNRRGVQVHNLTTRTRRLQLLLLLF